MPDITSSPICTNTSPNCTNTSPNCTNTGAGASPDVLRLHDTNIHLAKSFLKNRGLTLTLVEAGKEIPGSHWGDDEAGLIGNTVYARLDTPIHSLLHESCHWFLMSEERRKNLHTNAGGTSTEECAVCYMQILLSENFPPMNRERMFQDMDAWGYSFRMGSTREWFEQDAADAKVFLNLNEQINTT